MKTQVKTSNFREAQSEMRWHLMEARRNLCKAIRAKLEVHGRIARQGIETNGNDRRDYYWISITQNNKTYWLTLFYNEIDFASGNFHSQIGRIQFWKNIEQRGTHGQTPNYMQILDNDKRIWWMDMENCTQPNGRKGKPTYIDGEDYDIDKIAEAFVSFINEENLECEK